MAASLPEDYPFLLLIILSAKSDTFFSSSAKAQEISFKEVLSFVDKRLAFIGWRVTPCGAHAVGRSLRGALATSVLRRPLKNINRHGQHKIRKKISA